MLKEFTAHERKVVLGITFAVAVRMLGLFLLLPVLSPYVATLENSTPELVGLSIGVYGFAQAFLQIPFGYLSDKYGRKPVIIVGMLTYIIGSLVGGIVKTANLMVLARFVQGFGAVSSAMTALSADLVREEVRTRAFAHIGASIGLVFALSIVIAPYIAGKFGVPFLFFITAFLSFIATAYIAFFIPEPKVYSNERKIQPSWSNILKIIKSKDQLFLNFSIGLLHAYLVAIFTIIPYELVYAYNFPKVEHWKIYLPSILISLIIMVPAIVWAEKKHKFSPVFLSGISFIGFGLLVILLFNNFFSNILLFLLFFIGFNFLEPIIPSLLVRLTSKEVRGLSLGFFNTTQFIGAFVGGMWGGYALKHGESFFLLPGIFVVIVWLLISFVYLKNLSVPKKMV